MGSRSGRVVALMSIQPEFVERIMAGEKRVEFRKTSFSAPISHVIIYSTQPVRKITGFFEVGNLDMADPQELWERYERTSGISQAAFDAYYSNCESGVAIEIGHVFKLAEPLPLSTVSHLLQPPQSFRYVETNVLEYLLRRVVLQTLISLTQAKEAATAFSTCHRDLSLPASLTQA